MVAVIGAFDLDDDVLPGEAPGEMDGVHGGFGSGVVEPHLRQPKTPGQFLSHLNGREVGCGEMGALAGGGRERLGYRWVSVSHDHHSESIVEIGVLVAVYVDDLRTLASLDI